MSTRLQWLDNAKGITIILMVLGHTSIPQSVSNFIWTFHMPLFFIASGWTTNWEKYSVCEFFAKKAKTLLLPFVVYSTMVLLLYENLIVEGKVKHWLLNGWEGYALWFIPVLFFALILGRIVYITPNKYFRYAMMAVLLLVGCLLSYQHLHLPWTLSSVPFASFLVLLGTELKRLQKWIDEPRWWILTGGFTLALGISHFWRLDMCFNSILPIIPLTVGAVAGTMMMFTLSSYIAKYTKLCSYALQTVGRETYVVVAFSQIIIILLNNYFILNTVVKYVTLVVLLVTIAIIKNAFNKLIGEKIL